ncbi:MAG: DoxX family membrane protein [Rhodobacteraceae bacterium]|nr:DoxX family membrane protein [Paracoccaceae bacterium]MCF8513643.1 DoxX family membrane protein [Paracoccaceae bacterium]MCF8517457.1 DoxX family membrane protein [Paracoccaceae bacterium]
MYLASRLLLGLLFLGGAAQKAIDPAPVQMLLGLAGLPSALVWPALAFNLIAGVCLLTGPHVRLWAVLLALYCIATSFFHLLLPDAWRVTIFVKNWAIAGGLLAVAEVERLRQA